MRHRNHLAQTAVIRRSWRRMGQGAFVVGLVITAAILSARESPLGGRTLAATGTVTVAFSPWDKPAESLIHAIQGARKQILVQAYSFTHKGIARALIDAHQRKVEVLVLADREQARRSPGSQIDELAAAGISVYFDDRYDAAHNKVMVIDADSAESVLITGSYNFTHAAETKNAENLLLFRGNAELAQAYASNWRRHRDGAVRE